VAAAEHVLTLDLGTSACKASLFRLDGERTGEVAAQASVEYPTLHPAPGWAEQDADAWWDAACAGARRLPPELLRTVAAVGLSSHRGGVVPVDGAGRPLARCLIWMDRRTAPELAALVRDLGRERIHAVTGLVPDAEFTASKVLWLRLHEPAVFGAATLYLQPRDYLYLRLTGEPATDYTLASRTMLFDVSRRVWWADACARVGVTPEVFPRVYPSTAAPCRVSREAAAALGVPAGAPVALGAGDRPCEVLGAAAGDGCIMVSTGTTTNVSAVAPRMPAALDPRVMCSLHAVEGEVVLEQGMSASGAILRWLRDRLLGGRASYHDLDALAAQAPAGSDRLLFLPFMMGARATRWDPDARGVWFGLTEAHGVGALARSAMEGVAYEVRACLRLLERMGIAVREVAAVGGGARSALWCQIFADVLDRPIGVPRQTDAASLGAGLIAAAAIGRIPALPSAARGANPVAATYRPARPAARAYRDLSSAYDRLYEALRPVFPEIRDSTPHGRRRLTGSRVDGDVRA
jgi:xylulokinase